MKPEPKLEPLACPCCQSTDLIVSRDWVLVPTVRCRKCGIFGAYAAWNTRTPPSAEPRKIPPGNIAEVAPHASYCDVALGDAQYEGVDDKGERLWFYDDAKFDKSLAGNGYKVVPITPPSADAPIAGMSLAEIEALANEGCLWCGGRKRVLLAMVECVGALRDKGRRGDRDCRRDSRPLPIPARRGDEVMAKWNYRVFRCADPDGSPYYEMRETHYDEAGNVNGWAEGAASPMGETFDELISDLAWIMAALSKPILADQTGLECEPAQMLADDLQKWMDARADTEGEA